MTMQTVALSWEESNRLMNLDIQRNQQNYQQNHQ